MFIIEVVGGLKNAEVASSLSNEPYVYVCVARIACAADRPTYRGAGRSRGRAAGRRSGRGRGRGGAAAGPGRGGGAAGPGRGGADDGAPFLSYGDNDVPNVLPSFDPSDVGFQLPGYHTRGTLIEAKDIF